MTNFTYFFFCFSRNGLPYNTSHTNWFLPRTGGSSHFPDEIRVIRAKCCEIMPGSVCVWWNVGVANTHTHLIHSFIQCLMTTSHQKSHHLFTVFMLIILLYCLLDCFCCFTVFCVSLLISLCSAAFSLLTKLRLSSLYLQEPGGRSQVIREIQLTWTDDLNARYKQAGGKLEWNTSFSAQQVICSLFPG